MSNISNFKYHKVATKGFQCIGLTQQLFEQLWAELNRIKCNEYEKLEALNKLKEACHWFTRGIAITNADINIDKEKK